MIGLFKILLCLKICGGLKSGKFPGCCGPGMWNVKQKDNGIDQNALQCCYGHYVTKTQQTLLNKTYCQSASVYHKF